MTNRVGVSTFLALRDSGRLVVDVRSPGEYAQGHIPGAVNIPLFSDEERVDVGTRYKQINREAALHRGLEYVGSRLVSYLKDLGRLTPSKAVLLYCWRGGMRSASMAWLFEMGGYSCTLLEGGFKAYRQEVLDAFELPIELVVVGGMTGTGKSDILRALEEMGEQVLFLEEIAHHKGSAFGALGQESQPTTLQFEHQLYEVWRRFDSNRPVFLEDESAAIGTVSIPKPLFAQMRQSNLYLLELAFSIRKTRIEREYAHFPPDQLKAAIVRIRKRLGDESMNKAIDAIDNRQLDDAIDIILRYYDKAYRKGNAKRPPEAIKSIPLSGDNPQVNAQVLRDYLHREKAANSK